MRSGLLHPVRDPARPGVRLRQLPGARLLLIFDDDYFRVLEPFHSERETRRETASVRELLGLAQDDRVLDLGCGWGRHLRLLFQAGHAVVGVDRSLPLLRRAARDVGDMEDMGDVGGVEDRRPQADRACPPLVAGDMLQLPCRDESFDVVLNLATSLGLFLDDQPARDALREAARVLRAGGRLLIEGMNRDDVVARYAVRDAWTLDDGTEVRVRRRFDDARAVSHEVLRWRGPAGGGTKRHSLRLRSVREVVGLLEDAGLAVEACYGGWDGEEVGPRSERLIVVARR